MLVDTLSDVQLLLDALHVEYGIEARSAEFLVGAGESAYAYRVDAGADGFVHVKRVEPGGSGHGPVADGFYLRLLEPLRERVYARVPRVVPTLDGECAGRLRDDLLVVTDWIAGATLPAPGLLPARLREPLARAVGKIHAGTDLLPLDAAPVERFELPFEASLVEVLERLTDAPEDVRQLIGPRVGQVRSELERLHAVRGRLSARRLPNVLSHADLHGGNMILDSEGELWILDWEGAHLAPCEQDLAGVTNAHIPRAEFGAFVASYLEARGGPVPLSPDAFEFYFRWRCLEDLEAFLSALIVAGRDPLQRAHELALTQSECLAWLDRMEDDVRFVRAELSAVRT